MSLAQSSIAPPLPSGPVNLADGRVHLRRFGTDDIPQFFHAVRESMSELSAWLPWCHSDYSLEDAAKFVNNSAEEWRKDSHYSLAITDATSGEFLGGIGLNFINRAHQLANLGYWVRSRRTQRGAATAAVRLLARFSLGALQFNRLEIVAAVGNTASQRVAQKAGAQREGIMRCGICLRGQPHDAVLFSLISADLQPVSKL